MGLYHRLYGNIAFNPYAFDQFVDCEIEKDENVAGLLKHGEFEYDLKQQELTFAIETKRKYLFEGFYKIIAYCK